MSHILPLPSNNFKPEKPDVPPLPKVTCPYCHKKLASLSVYYSHAKYYHSPAGTTLKNGKNAGRAPLASELLSAMGRAVAGVKNAARELDVSPPYFRKWARILIPEEFAEYKKVPLYMAATRKEHRLGDLHCTESYKRFESVLSGNSQAPLSWGKYPHDNMRKLIKYGLLPDSCMLCGFSERRIDNYRCPVLLDFIDDNKNNWKLENLRVLCYNCYFLNVHDMWGRSKADLMDRIK